MRGAPTIGTRAPLRAFGDAALATVGADGGLRVVAARESGELDVTAEADAAHDLEAWAVAFALDEGGRVVATGADDAAFKGWDVRSGLDAPVFVNRRAHAAGVTCVAPSPHDAHVIATGSYDDRVRLWDVRNLARPGAVRRRRLRRRVVAAQWHPRAERRVAVAAMGGGVSVLDWTGRRGGVATNDEGDGEMRSGVRGSRARVLRLRDTGQSRTAPTGGRAAAERRTSSSAAASTTRTYTCGARASSGDAR